LVCLKLKRLSLKNRHGSEPEGVLENRSSTLESYVKSTFNTSGILTVSSKISRKHLTEHNIQLYRPQCESTPLKPI
ncbi:MAG: hypothetical protein AB2693_25385, partial [Candidatus Thiodiazotropha sp.]